MLYLIKQTRLLKCISTGIVSLFLFNQVTFSDPNTHTLSPRLGLKNPEVREAIKAMMDERYQAHNKEDDPTTIDGFLKSQYEHGRVAYLNEDEVIFPPEVGSAINKPGIVDQLGLIRDDLMRAISDSAAEGVLETLKARNIQLQVAVIDNNAELPTYQDVNGVVRQVRGHASSRRLSIIIKENELLKPDENKITLKLCGKTVTVSALRFASSAFFHEIDARSSRGEEYLARQLRGTRDPEEAIEIVNKAVTALEDEREKMQLSIIEDSKLRGDQRKRFIKLAFGDELGRDLRDYTTHAKWDRIAIGEIRAQESDYGDIAETEEVDYRRMLKALYDKEDALGRVASRETDFYNWNNEIFRVIADKAGIDLSSFDLDILNSNVVNCEIHFYEKLGEAEKNCVLMYAGLLRELRKKYGTLKAGHMAFLFGHELAHFKEGHYEDVLKEEAKPAEDEEQTFISQSFREAKFYLLRKVFARRQEELVDSRALEWMFELGFDPEEGIEVLELFKELEGESEEKYAKHVGNKERPKGFGIKLDIFETHPMNDTRLARARGVVSSLRLTYINRPPIKRVKDSGRNEINDWKLYKRHIKPTRIQESLKALENIFEDRDPKDKDFPWKDIYKISRDAKTPEEISHLILVTQLHFTIFKDKPPLPPYLYWAPGKARSERLGHLQTADWYREFLENMEPITRDFDALMEKESAKCRTAEDTLKHRFKKWFLSRAIYPYEKEAEEAERLELIKMLLENPEYISGILDEVGVLYFDLSELDPILIGDVAEKMEDEDEARAFIKLILMEKVDLRKSILGWTSENCLLDDIQGQEKMISIVKTIRDRTVEDGTWGKIEYSVGENITFWAEEHLKDRGELEAFITALRQLNPALQQGEYEEIEIPLVALIFQKSSKFHLSYTRARSWLVDHYEKSKMRDELLFMLLDEKTNFRSRYYEPGSNLTRKVGKFYFPHEKIENPPKGYINAMDDVAPYLDMTWFKTRISKMDSVSYDRFREQEKLEDDEIRRAREREREKGDRIVSNERYLISEFLSRNTYFLHAPTTRLHNISRDYLYPYLHYLMRERTKKKKRDLLKTIYGVVEEKPFLEGIFTETVADAVKTDPFSYVRYQGHLKNPLDKSWGIISFFDDGLDWLHERILSRNKIEHWVYALLSDCPDPFRGAYKRRKLERLLQKIPEGAMRDYLIAKSLLCSYQTKGGSGRKIEKSQKLRRMLLSHVRSSGRTQELGADLDMESLEDTVSKVKQNILWRVYRNYDIFLSIRRLDRDRRRARAELEGDFPRISLYPAGYFNDLAASKCFEDAKKKDFESLTIEERFHEIMALYKKKSNARDAELLRWVFGRDPEFLKYVFNGDNSDFEKFLFRKTALDALDALISPADKFDLGRKIYKRLKGRKHIRENLDAHVELIKRTHPKKSPAREKAIAELINGGYTETSRDGYVETWDQVDLIAETLEESEKTTTDENILTHSVGIGVLERAVKDARVDTMDKVNTILWLIGLKDKSYFVECCELVYDKDADDYRKESSKLTSFEKEAIIKEILCGEKGVLRSQSVEAKKEFLNTLFISVFDETRNLNPYTRRYFKSTFDAMMNYMDPERAGEVMARFLTCHLEGKGFNELVKLFFESFGFIGIKIAQYLVSNTGMIPDDMKEVLMELTSRVEGPDKRVVFETAEKIYGKEVARKVIKRVKRKLGGGSLMIFYEVEIEPSPGVRKSCAVGILRDDIVKAIPEDLMVVHRIIETMEEKPEIFGYNTISMNLIDNLSWQSMVETDLKRTVDLQEKMAKNIDDFMEKGLAEEGVSVSMPHIMKERFVIDEGEGSKKVRPNQGPLIWMDIAEGETLDLYMKKAEKQKAKGKKKIRKIMQTIATLSVYQLMEYGAIHADLHPGNILIKEEGNKIKISLIDVGLGTEIDEDFQKMIRQIIGAMLRPVKTKGKKTLEEIFGGMDALKSALGVSEASEDEGREWVRNLMKFFQKLAGKKWPEKKVRLAEDEIWKIVRRRGQKVQAKISDIMSVARRMGVYIPRQFYYVMRMFGVMDYIRKEIDGVKLVELVKKLTAADKSHFSDESKDRIIAAGCAVLWEHDCDVDEDEVRDIIDEALGKESLLELIRVLRERVGPLMREKGIDSAEKREEIMLALASDDVMKAEFKIGPAERYLKGLAQEGREKEVKEKLRIEKALGRMTPLKKGEAGNRAKRNEFGRIARVWKIERLHPGTIVFQRAHEETRDGKKQKIRAGLYIVTDVFQAKTGEIEKVGLTPLHEVCRGYLIEERRIKRADTSTESGEDDKRTDKPEYEDAGMSDELKALFEEHANSEFGVEDRVDSGDVGRYKEDEFYGEKGESQTRDQEIGELNAILIFDQFSDDARRPELYKMLAGDYLAFEYLQRGLTTFPWIVKAAQKLIEEKKGIPNRLCTNLHLSMQGVSFASTEGKVGEKRMYQIGTDALAILFRFLENNTIDLLTRAGNFHYTEPIAKFIEGDSDWQDNLMILDRRRPTPFRDLVLAKGETPRQYEEYLREVKKERDAARKFPDPEEVDAKYAEGLYNKDAGVTVDLIKERHIKAIAKREDRFHRIRVNKDRVTEAQLKHLKGLIGYLDTRIDVRYAKKGKKAPTFVFEYCEKSGPKVNVLGTSGISVSGEKYTLKRTLAILNLGILTSSIPKDANPGAYRDLITLVNRQYALLQWEKDKPPLIREGASLDEILSAVNAINIILPPITRINDFDEGQEFELERFVLESA